MTAKLIDGKVVAASVQDSVRKDAEMLKTQHGVTPGLATVLVGENPASKTYVGMKQKMTQELGMFSD
jgi:methylenetetrahydrofolate dehydrogenase (NADP+)/methenyltetrahydrofolate cyclohydrolase